MNIAVKNVLNGMTGISMSAATVYTQIETNVSPIIKLLAGIGGLIVIGMTIFVSYKTAKKTDLERAKLEEELQQLRDRDRERTIHEVHRPPQARVGQRGP